MPRLAELREPIALTVERRLATGGMGHVFLAVQHGVEGFRKTVALKTIRGRYSRDPDFVRMFIGEAKLVADLVHQNIVQVYHLGRSSGILYIVMEYVDGVTLEEFIRRHRDAGLPIPIELAAFIASRICRGLEYAHRKTGPDGRSLGVVHRDVSPRNVLVTRLGEVKITDFGIALARNFALGPTTGRLMGKYAYMAPEQARRESADHRSDLFSLGLVLREMLTAKPVFEESAGSAESWLEAIRSQPVPPICDVAPGLPSMLAEIVDRAVAHDPASRYQEAGRMGYDLEYFMYHKGYGPTIVTLERYLDEVFPERAAEAAAAAEERDTLVDHLRPESPTQTLEPESEGDTEG